MIDRLKAAMRRLAGAAPPDSGTAEQEIRFFVAALGELAMFARVGSQIVRSAMERRP